MLESVKNLHAPSNHVILHVCITNIEGLYISSDIWVSKFGVFMGFEVMEMQGALKVLDEMPDYFGYAKVDRRGLIMLTFRPAIGERKCDSEKETVTEVGSFISLGPGDSCEFFHDPLIQLSAAFSVCVGDSVAAEVRRSVTAGISGIKGTKRNVEVWQALLVVRSLVFPPTDEDSETWLKFASLCRKSGRISQAKSTLIKLLQDLAIELSSSSGLQVSTPTGFGGVPHVSLMARGMSPSAVAEGMVLVFFASKCNMSFGSTFHEQIHWAHKRCHGFDQLDH
ncbi:unnamed protein product [Lactuca saligna]|uniref:PIK-related kinase FAT domain-containing protein n=1 Tax=Lactuca saligna TaxID=75948 RepID=A0AA35ZLA2_LACSI|nr:unnamed protein product [Lactuca saligna]